MKNIKKIVEHLIAYGWVVFNIREITPHIGPMMSGFKDLIKREEEYREKWKFHFPQLSLQPDYGLIPPKGHGFDQKHMLMWRRNLKGMLLGRFEYEQIERYAPMLAHIEEVFNLTYKHLLAVTKEFDKQMPGYSLFREINKQSLMSKHVMRLPEYIYDEQAPERLFSAKPHWDLCAVTTQLFQTDEGLILQGYDDRVVEYEYNEEEGSVVMFFGDKMDQLTDGRFPAVPHAVLAKAKRNRNSLMHFAHTDHPTRERDGKHFYPKFEGAVLEYVGRKTAVV